jgi:hypothetical protein
MFSAAPPPGRYNLRPDDIKVVNTIDWSKNKYDRFSNSFFVSRDALQAAADYEKMERVGTAPSMRYLGTYKGPYVGKQYAEARSAKHTFGAVEDRFKHSFCGRLDVAAQMPGMLSFN